MWPQSVIRARDLRETNRAGIQQQLIETQAVMQPSAAYSWSTVNIPKHLPSSIRQLYLCVCWADRGWPVPSTLCAHSDKNDSSCLLLRLYSLHDALASPCEWLKRGHLCSFCQPIRTRLRWNPSCSCLVSDDSTSSLGRSTQWTFCFKAISPQMASHDPVFTGFLGTQMSEEGGP